MENLSTARNLVTQKHSNKNFRKEGFGMKKIISLALSLVTMLTLFVFPTTVSAANTDGWPSLSQSSYAEFYATKTIPVYRDSACTVRGSSSPAQSYSAEIWSGDTCRIIEGTWDYLKVMYPTSSGMRTGYIKRNALFYVPSPTKIARPAQASVVVYADMNGTYYGQTAVGDEIYDLGSPGAGSGYTWVMYTAISGSRHWKIGLVTISDWNKMLGA